MLAHLVDSILRPLRVDAGRFRAGADDPRPIADAKLFGPRGRNNLAETACGCAYRSQVWDARSSRTLVAAAILFPPDPFVPHLHLAAFDHRPGDAVGGVFLARVANVGFMGVIERLAVDVLRVFGQMVAHR